MNKTQQDKAALEFQQRWTSQGYEKGHTQPFWIDLLRNVYEAPYAETFIQFEKKVKLDHTNFIDGYILSTKVLIEQKGSNVDLNKAYPQSDGKPLTPFQQAKRYAEELPHYEKPRWIVVSNFREWHIHDMNLPGNKPEVVLLENFHKEYHRLAFLVDKNNEHITREMEISVKAGKIIGEIYDKLLAQYLDPTSPETLHSLNMLCVRLVFCLYAEDAGIFGRKQQFGDYIKDIPAPQLRRALLNLFEVLDTPLNERDPYLEPELAAFPYVNGGLFTPQDKSIPQFTDGLRDLLLGKASDDFDWSEISPTIFGAIFESTLNPDTRRSGGMHYTSIENIHKVIDPLFLNDLRAELDTILTISQEKKRNQQLRNYQQRLASLRFLDPACGSGNFLTETFLSLRRLENECLKALLNDQAALDFFDDRIFVNIHQFYGIEINDFAATVAKTALWIAESQMVNETAKILARDIDFLPLKSYSNIIEGNALTLDWNEICPAAELSYIIGNPPFIGARMMAQGSEQKQDIENIFGKIKDVQDLDYVCGWYKKAAEIIQGTNIQVGFVSTNSICQGSQVPILWQVLLNDYHIHINFAHTTFKWNSESNEKAAVFCVIIGFGVKKWNHKRLYNDATQYIEVNNISPYLFPGSNVFVVAQKATLSDAPKMCFGNQPRDGGFFIFSAAEKDDLLRHDPTLGKWIKQYMGAEEFINGKQRYCLWLKNASPLDIKQNKFLYERVTNVKLFREKSSAKTTQGYAKVPHLFAQLTQPDNVPYLLVPRVSSERRKYIPIGYMPADVISSDAVQIIPNASLFHFGVMTSCVHMAWMRVVCGRLKSDYRYSKELVYNCFPWCQPTAEQKTRIEATAQAILDVRAKYPDTPFSVLYDETTMPADLRKAHMENDRAVMKAYGLPITTSESDTVAHLFKLYEELTK